jgi:hypothetical protein
MKRKDNCHLVRVDYTVADGSDFKQLAAQAENVFQSDCYAS